MRSCAKPAINVTEWVASTQVLIKISPSCHCMPPHLSPIDRVHGDLHPPGSAVVCWRVSWAEPGQDRWGCFIISKLIGAVFAGCTWNPFSSSFCHLIQHHTNGRPLAMAMMMMMRCTRLIINIKLSKIPFQDVTWILMTNTKPRWVPKEEEKNWPAEEPKLRSRLSVSRQSVELQDFIITVPWRSQEGIRYKK